MSLGLTGGSDGESPCLIGGSICGSLSEPPITGLRVISIDGKVTGFGTTFGIVVGFGLGVRLSLGVAVGEIAGVGVMVSFGVAVGVGEFFANRSSGLGG